MINIKQIISFILTTGLNFILFAQNEPFVIVLDAGHGGHDNGAIGVVENEKYIALDVTLRVGQLIEEQFKDKVKVIYTRKTDIFLPLYERAAIANKSKANLFVSIHCNSAARRAAAGTETFIMGMRRMAENKAVADKENEVILLEKDKGARYKSIEPNSPELQILLDVMHRAHQSQSTRFAQLVEEQFVNRDRRFSRGVKQDIFHVLRETAMPSVLIELGFVSNSDEGTYLASVEGKEKTAQSIFEAFKLYKKEFDFKNGIVPEVEKVVEKEKPLENSVLKVYLISSPTKISTTDRAFSGLAPIEIIQNGNNYAYYYGETKLRSEGEKFLEKAKRQGFKNAELQEIKPQEPLKGDRVYAIQFLAADRRYKERHGKFGNLKNVYYEKVNKSLYLYYYGEVSTLEEANRLLKEAKDQGFKNAYVAEKVKQ